MAKQKSGDGVSARPKKTPIFYLFWFAVLALWGVFLAWSWFPPRPGIVEEFYSRGVYRAVLTLLTTFTIHTSQSVAVWLAACGIPAFFLVWILRWAYLRRTGKGSHWRGLFWGVKWAFVLTPVVLVWFLLFWGAGYQRTPIEQRLGLDTAKITEAEAGQMRGQLLAVIQNNVQPADQRDVPRAIAAIAQAMTAIVTEWDGIPIVMPKAVKATPKGLLMINGTSGMCSPLTLEPQVDGALPDAAFVSVAAHELSHIAGICGEADASFLGYAAGLKAEDPLARYAVALGMYRSLAAQLPGEQRKAAFQALPPIALEDMRKEHDAHQKYQIHWFEKLSWSMYNKYLTSRGVSEGVRDYGRGITLFAAAWRKGMTTIPAPVAEPAAAPEPAPAPASEPAPTPEPVPTAAPAPEVASAPELVPSTPPPDPAPAPNPAATSESTPASAPEPAAAPTPAP